MIMLIDMEKNKRPKHGGSITDCEVIRRSRLHRHNKLILDYFCANLVYLDRYFWCRFRMAPDLFLHIAYSVKEHDQFFVQRRNCTRDLGHISIFMVTMALHDAIWYSCRFD